jgi:hypothetical protein
MFRRAFVYLFAVCAVVLPATSAVLTTYTDNATFTAALSSQTLIDFDTLSTGEDSTAAGLTIGGINFVGMNNGGYYLATQNNGWNSGTFVYLPYFFGPLSYTAVTVPSGTTAVGFDLGSQSGTDSFTVTILGATAVVNTATFPAHTFFGVTSDTAFTTFQIQSNIAKTVLMDNFIFGTATTGTVTDPPPSDTPEAATLIMIGSGLLIMRFGGRRLHMFAA